MIFDNHSHTAFSSDSEMQLDDALAAAESLGLGLVVTEHYDYDYLDSKHYQDRDFRFDAARYWEQYAGRRGDKLRLGVEVGITDTCLAANQEFIAKAPFDLIIGSVHMIDLLDLYYPDFYQDKSKAESYRIYLQVMAQEIRRHSYIDVLGHIDYICRYADYEDKELEYGCFQEEIDAVLRGALETDTVMELNTRRLGDKQSAERLLEIYRRYHELGGRYVTLGSDAHTKENVGMNFKTALAMAEAAQLQPVTFCQRQMQICKF